MTKGGTSGEVIGSTDHHPSLVGWYHDPKCWVSSRYLVGDDRLLGRDREQALAAHETRCGGGFVLVDGRGDEFDRQALGVKQPVGPSHVQPRMIGVGGPIEGDLDVLVGRHGIFRTSYECTNTATQKKKCGGG